VTNSRTSYQAFHSWIMRRLHHEPAGTFAGCKERQGKDREGKKWLDRWTDRERGAEYCRKLRYASTFASRYETSSFLCISALISGTEYHA